MAIEQACKGRQRDVAVQSAEAKDCCHFRSRSHRYIQDFRRWITLCTELSSCLILWEAVLASTCKLDVRYGSSIVLTHLPSINFE